MKVIIDHFEILKYILIFKYFKLGVMKVLVDYFETLRYILYISFQLWNDVCHSRLLWNISVYLNTWVMSTLD